MELKVPRKGRRTAILTGIGAVACGALAVPLMSHRWIIFDAVEAEGPADGAAVHFWKESMWIRARLFRLSATPPSSVRTEVVAVDEKGFRPPSTYPEDGGTRIEVDLDFAFSRGIWMYYLPRNWPDCIQVNANPGRVLPGHVVNLNRYLDCHLAKYIEIREIFEAHGSDPPAQ